MSKTIDAVSKPTAPDKRNGNGNKSLNGSQSDQGWSRRRASHKKNEKALIAEHFAAHDLLVRQGHDPETQPREKVASIFVNPGTTPNTVVGHSLNWVHSNIDSGPFDITWFTPGGLVPATLRDFRLRSPHLSSASQVFLFPGIVDPDQEAVTGPEALNFAQKMQRCFTYALLSAHSFDVLSGTSYFHYSTEVELQKACASLYAAHKFLFLDSSKFKREGHPGYGVRELLETSEAVTIYTVCSENDDWIMSKFEALCDSLLDKNPSTPAMDRKLVRLRIVGEGDKATEDRQVDGFLKRNNR